MTDVRLCSHGISFVHSKIVLEFSCHYSQIMNEIGAFPGTLKIDGIKSLAIKYIICRIGVIVNPATIRRVQYVAMPPLAQKSVIIFPSIKIQFQMVQNLMEFAEF